MKVKDLIKQINSQIEKLPIDKQHEIYFTLAMEYTSKYQCTVKELRCSKNENT
jgi:hypothetical protein